ncbi:GDP-mannose 4,6-dehydratase [Sphingomonas mollis]|uniref:GDP-mannose 4,6-dehydratase n=1 Tax=Sphingomonas mollis TaxID=2795726 RepID=A0ABS0XTG8_9SPHN|nr:GDP-mannose 4,6-dehydratase [Sphingomonas sp. BT553]MBJ6123344.1 GDP-mannose 4,6-dehydratase [Sphingomonas sp. BT553]
MQVALTGASGFTGRFVTEALKTVGVECIPIEADLTDADAVEQVIANTDFDRVIHLAARAFVGVADWQAFYRVNQIGTFTLLDAVARKKPGARVVLASSAQVYGPGAEGLVTEDALINPANHYAVSKRAMELGAALWRDRLDLVITRPFNYTGNGQGTDYLIPKLVDHFRRRENVVELGNTWVKRDFGDVRSVAQAYAGLIVAEQPPQIVNICTGVVNSIEDILRMLSQLSRHTIDVRINPAYVRNNDVPFLGGNVKRLRDALPNWQPRTLEDTLAWMYNHEHESIR